jgi:hypothetical protein
MLSCQRALTLWHLPYAARTALPCHTALMAEDSWRPYASPWFSGYGKRERGPVSCKKFKRFCEWISIAAHVKVDALLAQLKGCAGEDQMPASVVAAAFRLIASSLRSTQDDMGTTWGGHEDAAQEHEEQQTLLYRQQRQR